MLYLQSWVSFFLKTPPANELLANVSDGIIATSLVTLRSLSPGAADWGKARFPRKDSTQPTDQVSFNIFSHKHEQNLLVFDF